MSENKKTVEKYMEAFRQTDHAAILSCLHDDVEWILPGAFHLKGKEAFDGEIENDAFIGSPTINVTRLTEENDFVMAEGTVTCAKKDGTILNLAMCDVFEMEAGKVKRLISYVIPVNAPIKE